MSNQSSGRLNHVIKNFLWSTGSQISIALMGLLSRKIFLRTLGDELLGVNSLFADVLGLFSFVELGFGTAISFLLYRPIAEDDNEKVRSLLKYLEHVYRCAGLALVVVSVCFYPFLGSLKTEVPLQDLRIYYILYQCNNLLGYVYVYRDSYVSSIQRDWERVRMITVFNLATTVLQIIIVSLGGSYLMYLIVGVVMAIARKVTTNVVFAHRYPLTNLKGAQPLEKEDKQFIFRKVRALIVHKLANAAISQTDSLIVSCMVGVLQWGFVSNYLVLRGTISSILDRTSAAILPSMGNLVAQESSQKHLEVFKLYNFFSHWLYAFCFVALCCLSSPFVELFFGTYRVLDQKVVFVFYFAFFIAGMRDSVGVLREANGAYEQDQWVTVAAAIVNLITSIFFVSTVGLPGVFLGTICCMLIFVVARPILLFRQYGVSSRPYFTELLGHIAVTLALYGLMRWIYLGIMGRFGLSLYSFAGMCVLTAILPNLLWLLIFCRNPNLQTLMRLLFAKITSRSHEK